MRPRVGHRGRRLRLDGPGAQPLVCADPHAVRRSSRSPGARRLRRQRRGPARAGRREVRVSARRVETGAASSSTPTSTSSSSPRRTCSTSRSSRPPARPASTSSARSPSAAHPTQTARAAAPARDAGVITGVGYNYRFAPLVRHAKRLIDEGRLGRSPTTAAASSRCTAATRSACSAGASSRTRPATASRPTCSATRSTSPTCSSGRSAGSSARARPRSRSGRCPVPARTHYGRGAPDDPTGSRHERGLRRAAGRVRERRRRHVRGVAHARRPGEPDGVRGLRHRRARSWNLERMNELRVYLASDEPHRLDDRARRRALPAHGASRPGSATASASRT